MKRAEVRQEPWGHRNWCVGTHTQPRYVRHSKRIADRTDDYIEELGTFPTHADALAYALAAVGLTENTEKEKDR